MPTQYFVYSGLINQAAVNSFTSALIGTIDDQSITDITIALSTGGGGVTEGIALYNIIKSNPKPVTIHGLGNVDSIGITLMLAAKTRLAVEASRFFFHPLGFETGPARYDVATLTAKLAALTSDQNRLKAIYEANAKISDGEIDDLFLHEYMHDNDWAAAHGFISEQKAFTIPALARIKNLG